MLVVKIKKRKKINETLFSNWLEPASSIMPHNILSCYHINSFTFAYGGTSAESLIAPHRTALEHAQNTWELPALP